MHVGLVAGYRKSRGHPGGLEGNIKLKEIIGDIIFCESNPSPSGSNLIIMLKDFGKELRWYEGIISLPVFVGDTLRGFYEKDKEFIIDIKAYELLDGDKVLRRGRIDNNYKFIEVN